MSQASRTKKLEEVVERFPEDSRARYFLAHELFREEQWERAAAQYEAYVRLAPGDEGAALKNLGLCLERLGRKADAAEAYRRGVDAALAHGHDGLAQEIRFLAEALDDRSGATRSSAGAGASIRSARPSPRRARR